MNANATGWLLYDAECRMCVNAARRFTPLRATRDVRYIPAFQQGMELIDMAAPIVMPALK